jgi:DNA processing protein
MDGFASRSLTDAERLAWLRLIRSDNVGPATFYHLLRHFGSVEAAIDGLPGLARQGGRRDIRLCTSDEAAAELDRTLSTGARLLAAIEPDYPTPLAAVEDAPPILAVLGDTSLFERPTVAIVGARNASTNGKRFAEQLAADLGEAGFVIASGLARGVDGAAHTGALGTGTIAALAGGVDHCYPPEHERLYDEIVQQGALISEQPAGLQPQGRHFPRRNRLISGLSLGVVVVEAALRSGSLITARMALEQGREVFAIPGSPLDPRCRGTNNLLRQGAALTESAADVLAALDGAAGRQGQGFSEHFGDLFEPRSPAERPAPDLENARRTITENLSPSPTMVDELIRDSQMSPASVATVLLELELAGRLERLPGNRVALLI